tara:strand:- start:4763 stop:5425 length:663 start_codon:yes stop_codon:yes gene_type:complete
MKCDEKMVEPGLRPYMGAIGYGDSTIGGIPLPDIPDSKALNEGSVLPLHIGSRLLRQIDYSNVAGLAELLGPVWQDTSTHLNEAVPGKQPGGFGGVPSKTRYVEAIGVPVEYSEGREEILAALSAVRDDGIRTTWIAKNGEGNHVVLAKGPGYGVKTVPYPETPTELQGSWETARNGTGDLFSAPSDDFVVSGVVPSSEEFTVRKTLDDQLWGINKDLFY